MTSTGGHRAGWSARCNKIWKQYQNSVDFLCEDHHITKNVRENISKELDNLSRKLEAISTRVDSLDAVMAFLNRMSMSVLKPPRSSV